MSRQEKIQEVIRALASTYLAKHAGGTSLITVTNVSVSSDGRTATLYFTTLPQEKEQAAYGFLKRHVKEIREIIKQQARIHPVPYIEVAIDAGEHHRQKIDQLLRES